MKADSHRSDNIGVSAIAFQTWNNDQL